MCASHYLMTPSFLSRIVGTGIPKRFLSTCQRLLAAPQVDALQEAALDQESCILVDDADRTVGAASKRACHVVAPDGSIPLHRAFSLFLFNTRGEMLMQRRGKKKVTFPNVYTNACCSHPLWMDGQEESIISAVQRRLTHELGIPPEQMSPSDFTLLTRIHYHHTGDGRWGEHEMDYILFMQKDVYLEPNKDEIDELVFVPKAGLEQTISKFDAPISPWFKLIMKHRLKFWWDNLHQLEHCKDDNIHKFP